MVLCRPVQAPGKISFRAWKAPAILSTVKSEPCFMSPISLVFLLPFCVTNFESCGSLTYLWFVLFYTGRKTYAHEPDLQDLIEYLQTDDAVLIMNSASYLQHLCYSDEGVKAKIR